MDVFGSLFCCNFETMIHVHNQTSVRFIVLITYVSAKFLERIMPKIQILETCCMLINYHQRFSFKKHQMVNALIYAR